MPDDTRIGTEIAGFRIESQLGRGGMGVVYLAQHLRLDRKVALKVLAPELGESEKFRERFIRESRVAASIDHPNIVPIYDADERDGLLFIAMRYVEGTDLRKLLKAEGTLEPIRVLAIVEQVASALDAAHARGLVHRDVKPGNVLLTAADHVYLSDFGLTKRALSVSGLTKTGQLVGTIDYVAPEHIKGAPVDGRADVYSLGCVAYECLTGSVPFPREMEVAVLWAHVEEMPPRPSALAPDLSPRVDEAIGRALAKDPSDRPSTGTELTSDLADALGAEGAGRRSSGRWRPPRWAPRARSRRVLAIVTALIAVATAGVIALSRGGTRPLPGINTVTRIVDGSFDEPVDVGDYPTAVSFGLGRVWVANLFSEDLSWAEPGSLESDSRGASGRPTGVAAGLGGVWLSHGFGTGEDQGSDVAVFDPSTGQLTSAFPTDPANEAIAVGAGFVWVGDQISGRLLRYDPVTEELTQLTLDDADPPAPVSIAVGGEPERVWVADGLGSRVFRVDPTSGDVSTFGAGSSSPSWIALTEDTVWITSRDDDSVTLLEAGTGTPIDTISVGDRCNGPTGIAIGEDGVWISCSLSGRVIRLDQASRSITAELDVSGSPYAMTVDSDDHVWVVVREA